MKRNKIVLLLTLAISIIACAQNKSAKEKLLNQVKSYSDQLDAKVDSLNLFNEEPIPEIKINQQHKFEITPCEFKYNGKVFRLGGNIQELIDVFGMYNRNIRAGDAYTWDDYGFSVLIEYHTNTTKEFRICFDCCEWIDPNDSTGTMPNNCFEGGILIDGVALGNGLPFDVFKQQLREKGSEIRFGGFYRDNLYIYDYNCTYDGDIISDTSGNHALIIKTSNKSSNESKYRIFTISDSRAIHKVYMENDASQKE